MTREEIEGIRKRLFSINTGLGWVTKSSSYYRDVSNLLAHIDQLEAELARVSKGKVIWEDFVNDGCKREIEFLQAELDRVQEENERLKREVRLRNRVME